LGKADLKEAEDRFLEAHKKLLAEGGGVVSIVYHPCEFVHKEFWDGVNFRKGANPPREQWKLPPTKTAAETSLVFQVFEKYVQFMKHLPEVQFITASEAAQIYRDKARGRDFSDGDIVDIARSVKDNVTFQERGDFSLSAAEVFALLDLSFSARLNPRTINDEPMGDKKRTINDESIGLLGPTERIALMSRPITTDWSQFTRTASDVADYFHKHGRVPSTVWLGSVPVSPEAFLQALARVTIDLVEKKPVPKNVEIQPAKMAAVQYVADDGPNLWGWVIFPDGFRAPGMMALAKQQAWTLKPALIDRSKR
jgi:dipeptidyl aminopeptidase/acylaminoacyl peptidase